MSEKNHVAIVGAGIVGVSTAIWLLRAGHQVTLIDREGPAAGTSYGNGGVLASCGVIPVTSPGLIGKAPGMVFDPQSPLFLRWSYLPKLFPWLLKYLGHANETDVRRIASALTEILHDSVDQHIAVAKGTPAEDFIMPGDYVFAYKDRAAYVADGFGWKVRRDMGFEPEELEAGALHELEPVFDGKFEFGVKMAHHGRITDPGAYVSALADYAVELGGSLMIADVHDVVLEQGRVKALKTSQGELACDSMVLATGAWSGPLSKKLGIKVPLESERGYHIELINADKMPNNPIMVTSAKFVVTPMVGRLRCAGIVEFGGLGAKPSEGPFKLLEQQIKEIIPGIKYEKIERWMGHRPAPSDSIPLIGEFPGARGAYAAYGHHHIGLTGGPKTGRIVADMISGNKPNFDVECYSPSRFV